MPKEPTKEKPMEQDELAEVRKKIFRILFPYADFVRAGDNEMIDQILSLTLRRGGGECPDCKGDKVKSILKPKKKYPSLVDCPTCKGTGRLPVEEKSIKDILGGWQDGRQD